MSNRPEGTEKWDDAESFLVTRDGDLDLSFKGWKIGTGSHGWGNTSGFAKDNHRGIKVAIYLTTGSNLVVSIHRWTHWQNEDDSYCARSFQSPNELFAFLKMDNNGDLGIASKEAWEAACDEWICLAGKNVEEVE